MWNLWSWLVGKKEEDPPPEPLVLGALLTCDYGSQKTFLVVGSDDICINDLPKACIEDTKALINIMPFGICNGSGDCIFKLNPSEKWINAEPQNARVNGKEIITTKSMLVCQSTGMTIRPETSGQDGMFARLQIFLKNMDRNYPGLREVLEDPYGSLYLSGYYEMCLDFLEEQMKGQNGSLEIVTLYDPNNLEASYTLAALERLLIDCDVRAFENFMSDLTETAIQNGMEEMEGWNKNYINEAMMELLRKDCKETAERIEHDAWYRAMEENKMFSSWLRESTNTFAYMSVIYASALAASKQSENVPKGKKEVVAEKEGGSGTVSNTTRLDNMKPGELNKLTPEQIKEALPDGWTYSGSPDGRFIHIKDSNGNYRMRIDPPDKITEYPHMHILDGNGNSLDINGNIVSPNSPDGHIPR